MQVRAEYVREGGSPCGCGRSPTGKCIGWHALTEEEFIVRTMEYIKQKEINNQEQPK